MRTSTLVALSLANVAAAFDAGYDAHAAAQVMIDKASHSWEWGTAAEALLELYNPELTVFAQNPFPNGQVPAADPSIFALRYAKQFINLNGQILVQDSAVGDPASLGVSAILLGQSSSAYLDASNRQANYILNVAPRWSNGAISQRADVAEIWADNMAMSFPFLAYLAVQNNNVSLMAATVTQCSLHRDVLKTSGASDWRHIIGPNSQDTGLWSTGNGWAAYGMTRVLHTLQKWPSSSSMTSQANNLRNWIQEILDGAMSAGSDGGLLRNYLDDSSWFGEVSGTAMLSAVAYRMAVNSPSQFTQKYVQWADANRKALAKHVGGNGLFSPTVDPYNWKDKTPYTSGSPEGQAFTVYLYTAYRDCVNAKVCSPPEAQATTISHGGIGPIDLLTVLDRAITFSGMPAPSGVACGAPASCDDNGCQGKFTGSTAYGVCQSGNLKGCNCVATAKTCGNHQSCDLNGCAGKFNGSQEYAQCTGNFLGCECTATSNTCGNKQGCDLNGCAGEFQGSQKYAQCTGNFKGCQCLQTDDTCGNPQSCDLNGCAGAFDLSNGLAYCQGNFESCQCSATSKTCGNRQSCDKGNCAGKFDGKDRYPKCTGFFEGCDCNATPNTCGSPQSCDLNGCAGEFNLNNGKAYCTGNFVGCECTATSQTCGSPQSCDMDSCRGKFSGNTPYPTCSNFFKGCKCEATSNTCGAKQSCDLNGCAGGYDSKGVARCQGNFHGCECNPTSNTCGNIQDCDLNGCDGTFDQQSSTARCRGKFKGCVCNPVASTCGNPQSCSLNGCDGAWTTNGYAVCFGNYFGCRCILGDGGAGPSDGGAPPVTTWHTTYEPPAPSPPATCTHSCNSDACDGCVTECASDCVGRGCGINNKCLYCARLYGCQQPCHGDITVQC